MLKRIKNKLRNYFIAGVLVAVPLAITFYVFTFVFNKLDNILAPAITRFLIQAGLPLPVSYRLPGIGIVATLLGVLLLGLFTTSYAGRKVVGFGETILHKIPFIRGLYSAAKQFMEAITTPENNPFRKVVMVEFPRKGAYSLGFITYDSVSNLGSIDDEPMINIFVPTVPNPTTGFFIVVPKNEVIILPLSVEDGFKLIFSTGVAGPREKLAGFIKKSLYDREKVEVTKADLGGKSLPPTL